MSSVNIVHFLRCIILSTEIGFQWKKHSDEVNMKVISMKSRLFWERQKTL